MEEIKTRFINGKGGFYLMEDGEQMGEMISSVNNNELTVHHTEVNPKAEGKGYAKKLLQAMAEYARQHHMQVIPECTYVQSQFKRHVELYADIWKQDMQ